MQWLGYVGLVMVAICWVPQSLETIRRGRCEINLLFLILSAVGSSCLMTYAFFGGDTVFSVLNAITTVGSSLNLYYKLFPRTPADSSIS